jgi:hypothetical protein
MMAIEVEIKEYEPFDDGGILALTNEERLKLEDILSTVVAEYSVASAKFGAFASGHEGIAIIQEEFEELKQSVFWPHKYGDNSTVEAKQVAAMAIRFLMDISYA